MHRGGSMEINGSREVKKNSEIKDMDTNRKALVY